MRFDVPGLGSDLDRNDDPLGWVKSSYSFALLAAAAALATLADRLRPPRPALFILGGAMLAAVPELPQPRFDPGTLFLLFVPPLLYRGAVQTSLRDFRIELGSIAFLSIGIVLATIATVGRRQLSWRVDDNYLGGLTHADRGAYCGWV